jgi:hypothetical protein
VIEDPAAKLSTYPGTLWVSPEIVEASS